MKNIIKFISYLFLLLVTINISLYSQNKEKDLSNLQIEFHHFVGGHPLKLDNLQYKNQFGEQFSITTFNYFVSNIILKKKNGDFYKVPQDSSYFLIKENNYKSKIVNINIPKGKYTAISFTVGVDSLRSTMDINKRRGALDISGGMLEGMYWTWNSGYIFLKLEGVCDQLKVDRTGQKKFRYHIGGFGGYDKRSMNNIRTVNIDLKEKGIINAKKYKKSTVQLEVDILHIFNGHKPISIAQNPTIMFSEISKTVSNKYTNMFSHKLTNN
ncbi:MbnP family protein [Flavobacterium sp. UMI-01]|uniref:MbnP family protein n=1 Tax=Flavobacterium sp. UMI-01 TaxID=1441053 RepID=UPI001C7E0860|nr:MbnP family protein [Flavobacterium sp. UMI-01]GIZ09038.1 hypothetical protein FUMI01_17650 [Flavobacterium sp. UMI-01]